MWRRAREPMGSVRRCCSAAAAAHVAKATGACEVAGVMGIVEKLFCPLPSGTAAFAGRISSALCQIKR
jgi:hypothetical protein